MSYVGEISRQTSGLTTLDRDAGSKHTCWLRDTGPLKYPDVISSTSPPTTLCLCIPSPTPTAIASPHDLTAPCTTTTSAAPYLPQTARGVNPRVRASSLVYAGPEEAGRGPPHAPRIRSDMSCGRPLRSAGPALRCMVHRAPAVSAVCAAVLTALGALR